MSEATEKLLTAQRRALQIAPRAGGFPALAEVLRQAGVRSNVWDLPSCQGVYMLADGAIAQQGAALAQGTLDVPAFNREALIAGVRIDQAGQGTFAEFLRSAWNAGRGSLRSRSDRKKRDVRGLSWRDVRRTLSGGEYVMLAFKPRFRPDKSCERCADKPIRER